MNRVKAFKFNEVESETIDNNNLKSAQIAMLAGIVEDFEKVAGALKSFPYRSALSLLGVGVLVFITFKVGTKFGMIKSRFKKKGI